MGYMENKKNQKVKKHKKKMAHKPKIEFGI